MKAKSALTVAMAAGIASTAAASNTPTTLTPTQGNVQQIAHIYYNVASGERVVTVLAGSQTAPADTGTSVPIWAALVQNPCEAQGYTTSYYFGVDDPTNTSMGGATALATNVTNLDMGDLPLDTVVDCVQVNWVVSHPDTDTDSDSVGDGVEELAGQWIVWDADNGRVTNQSTRLPLVDFLFFNLPGNVAAPGFLSGYTLDVDLVAGFTGTDLSFEMGDSDGDCQSAAFCNSSVFDSATSTFLPIAQCDNDFDSLADSDLDGDGLFDFSWTVRFYQPGIGNDFDSDSDTGSAAPSSADSIGISFGFPEGSASDNGDGTWTWNVDTSIDSAGTGAEDGFAIYNPPVSDGMGGEIITHNGFYWFGGFACEGVPIADGGPGYTPPAMFQFVLYGPGDGGCSPADVNGDGMLNFFDVSQFIQDYNAGGDYNGDGSTNFFDVSQFIQDYNAGGCP
ncbi:MAG: hypothetical protein ACF8MF_05460 [Phycisphaerales bacterium JB052]